jgi:tRNA A37 threonylcarbamoyladenosine biosynthesis protein TsaE
MNREQTTQLKSETLTDALCGNETILLSGVMATPKTALSESTSSADCGTNPEARALEARRQ